MGCELPCINKAGEDNDSYSLDTEITRPIKPAMSERRHRDATRSPGEARQPTGVTSPPTGEVDAPSQP